VSENFEKKEKLKSRKLIGQLFSEGKSFSAFPIRMIYLPLEKGSENNLAAVSAPKKNFKKATERNRIKRLMRESYRKNKYLLENLSQKHAFLFIYTDKNIVTYQQVFSAMEKLLKKFTKQDK
jgi:ribonuclease P protein component